MQRQLGIDTAELKHGNISNMHSLSSILAPLVSTTNTSIKIHHQRMLTKRWDVLTDKLYGGKHSRPIQNAKVKEHKRTSCHRLISRSDLKLVVIRAVEVTLVARS